MTVNRAKWTIAIAWLVGAGLVFALLVWQSLAGIYEPKTQDAWGWFLPSVMPTLLLIVGVLVTDARNPGAQAAVAKPANVPLFWLAMGASIFYLVLVLVAILAQAFRQDVSPLALMHQSNLWLGPLQGVTAGALAAFFRTGDGSA